MIAVAAGCLELRALMQLAGCFNQQGYSALLYGVAVNNHGAVNQLLQKELSQTSASGVTAMMIAAATGRIEMLKFLINTAPNLKGCVDSQGRSALRHAFDALDQVHPSDGEGVRASIELLLPMEAKITAQDGTTALMLCCKYGFTARAVELVESQGVVKNLDGQTALMFSAATNNLQMIKALQKEVKMTDKSGKCALMYACEAGHYDAFMELVKEEYDVRDVNEKHALHYAVRKDAFQIVEAVFDTFTEVVDLQGVTTMMEAAAHNAVQSMEFLSAETNMTDKTGRSALSYAAENDAALAVRHLIKQAKKTDETGRSALDFAIQGDSGAAFVIISAVVSQKTVTIIEACLKNKWRICKAIADVGRAGRSDLIKAELTSKEVTACKKQLQLFTKGHEVPDGLNPL